MVLFTGKTVDDAIETGLSQLGLSRSQASITIISKEKKGFLGFGKKLAQIDIVSLEVEAPVSENNLTEQPTETVEPINVQTSKVFADQQSEETEQEVTNQFEGDFDAFVAKEFSPEPVEETVTPAYDIDEASQAVLSYLEGIVYEMDVEATLSVTTNRRQMIVQIETAEPGRVIGYHGKVLKALQLLSQNYLHDHFSRYFNVAINVNDYLEHRTETLVQMAQKVARQVEATGRHYRMEPMSNSERKIIHKTIAQISGVESYSEGDDPNRYVIVVGRD